MPPQDPSHNHDHKAGATPPGNGSQPHPTAASAAEDADAIDRYSRRPAGERERFDDGRALRESQGRVLATRRQSFLVEFTRMKGPPQITLLMVLLAVGLGCTIGVVPAIMGDRFARLRHGYTDEASCSTFDTGNKPAECFAGGADAQAAASIGNLVQNCLAFVTASLTGSISDEYGRRGPLLLGLSLSLLPALVLCVLQEVPSMNPWWYYATSASTGLISWVTIAMSALNDVLPQEFRAAGVGLLLAGLLLGISLSPSLALFLSRKALTWVSFGTVFLGFLVTAFVVPETVLARDVATARKRRKDREARELTRDRRLMEESSAESWAGGCWRFYYGSPFCRSLRRLVVRPFLEMSILNRSSFFRLIGLLAFFTGMVTAGDQILLIYYLEDQLAFNAKDVSLMFLTIGVMGVFVQVVVLNHLNKAVGEKMVLVVSFVSGVITNLLYGIARTKSTIFVAVFVSCISTMAFPTVSAIKANNVGASEQGRIQGALYSVKSLATGVGPALMQMVYSRTKEAPRNLLWGGPGTMFVAAAGLFVIGIFLAVALPRSRANSDPRHGGTPLEEEEDIPLLAIDDAFRDEYQRLVEEEDGDSLLAAEDSDGSYGSI